MPKILENTREDYKDFFDNDLSKNDPELYNSIKLELKRQQEHLIVNSLMFNHTQVLKLMEQYI